MDSAIYYSYTYISGSPIIVSFNRSDCEAARDQDIKDYKRAHPDADIEELKRTDTVDEWDIAEFEQEDIDSARIWHLENNSAILDTSTAASIRGALDIREEELG